MTMPLTSIVNTFAGNPLDRCGDRRADADFQAAAKADPAALALVIWNGQVLAEPDGAGGERLAWLRYPLAAAAVGGRDERTAFLGRWREAPVFATSFEGVADPTAGPLAGLGRFLDLRAAGAALPAAEAAMAATAKSLFEWAARHRFCAGCGQESAPVDLGWKRLCPSCGTQHFPRVDPVTIMLPVVGDRCLLGRGVGWPEGRMSALAGYLEPGESIEEGCARELREEAGLDTLKVRYHSSQPWPFPSSLMIGLVAGVADAEASPDQTELEEVRWFTRDEIARMLSDPDGFDGVKPPPRLAIARRLMQAWAQEGFAP